jgi:hypothetical protein
MIEIAALVISACARCLVLWKFDRRTLLSFTRSSTVNREGWHGVTGSFLPVSATRHVSCAYVALLVREGSVSFYALLNQAPAILSLYRSPAWLMFLSRLVDAPLMLCPEDDPHSCALYYYTEPGDHIGFHHDTSYYKGKRHTVLIGLVDRSEHCRLVARVRKHGEAQEIRETRIPIDPGTVVLFNGDKLWHAVTPLGKGEERIILTLQYVTNQEMGPFKKMFPNLKDAFAYFGPAALSRWNPSKGKG